MNELHIHVNHNHNELNHIDMNVMDNSNYNLITYIQKLAYNVLK